MSRVASSSLALLVGFFLGACDHSGRDASEQGPDLTEEPCGEETLACDGNELYECRDETRVHVQSCPESCSPRIGCTPCVAGTQSCDGSRARICRPDGSGFDEFECDPLQGMTCDPDTQICEGACVSARLIADYVGCQYYPTVTVNSVDNSFSFAIATSNTSGQSAVLTVEGGALAEPLVVALAANDVEIVHLPWVAELKGINCQGTPNGCGAPTQRSALVRGGGYRLRSTQPITVYQFNALEYAKGDAHSYSNDASLLLPANALGESYVAAGWPAFTNSGNGEIYPGFVAITATEDATNVRLTLTEPVPSNGDVPAFGKGVPTLVTLHAGDVLQVMDYLGDLTGSSIESDRPVQVIAGHACTYVPLSYSACDHLEESIFPEATLARAYLVTPPVDPSTVPFHVWKNHVIRLVATQDDTTLTFDPPQNGVNTFLARRGDVVEIPVSDRAFHVTSNHKILVAQYMAGTGLPGSVGDPAMSLVVPTEQFRSSYRFHAPLSYDYNYVNVIAPLTATIHLDGTLLGGETWPIGSTGFGWSSLRLANGTGNHVIDGDVPFGITVYGYGEFTSYWYPGGLSLRQIQVD